MADVKMKPESLQIAVKERKDRSVKSVKMLFADRENKVCINVDLNFIRNLNSLTEQILKKTEGRTEDDHMVAYN